MENSFLSEFKEREYFNQCTNSEELEQLMNKKKIKAYIGFDCTAESLHVGSLLQIMCLRLLQKHGHRPSNEMINLQFDGKYSLKNQKRIKRV